MAEVFLSNDSVSQVKTVVEVLNIVTFLDSFSHLIGVSGFNSDTNSLFVLTLFVTVLK
jgi:hypothetical protein